MARGRNRKKASQSYSPCHLIWDPLDYCCEPEDYELDGWWTEPPGIPDPQDQSDPSTSEETLEWIRQCQRDGSVERRQRQRIPLSEWGWCEFCPQTRHREQDCAYTGPGFCCCCVYPEEEDDLRRELHAGGSSARSSEPSGDALTLATPLSDVDAVFPPAHPVPVVKAGPVAGPASPALATGPLPAPSPPRRLRSTAGSESWWGEYGCDGGGIGPEEEPASDTVLGGSEDGPVAVGGRVGRQDARPPALATPTAQRDSPGRRIGAPGPEPGLETASELPGSPQAAAPGDTTERGPVPTCAAAPLVTPLSDQGPSGGWMEDTEASTAAAPSAGPECDPGPAGPAAPPAAVESGPKIFAATPLADVENGGSPTCSTANPAAPKACLTPSATAAAPSAGPECDPGPAGPAAPPAAVESGGPPTGSTGNPAAPKACLTPSATPPAAGPLPRGPSRRAVQTPPPFVRSTSAPQPRRIGTRPRAQTLSGRARYDFLLAPPPSPCLWLSAPDARPRLIHDPGG